MFYVLLRPLDDSGIDRELRRFKSDATNPFLPLQTFYKLLLFTSVNNPKLAGVLAVILFARAEIHTGVNELFRQCLLSYSSIYRQGKVWGQVYP
jgi:hypothetical protein